METSPEPLTCFSWPSSDFLPFLELVFAHFTAFVLSWSLALADGNEVSVLTVTPGELAYLWPLGCVDCAVLFCSVLLLVSLYVSLRSVSTSWAGSSHLHTRRMSEAKQTWPLPSRTATLSRGVRVTSQRGDNARSSYGSGDHVSLCQPSLQSHLGSRTGLAKA